MFMVDEEVWYERVTAIRLTQKNENNELVDRYFPQVERSLSIDGEEAESDWVVISDEDGATVFYDSELEALQKAIEYRNTKNSY